MPGAASRPTRCETCPLKSLEVFRAVTPQELAFIDSLKSGEFATETGTTVLLEGSSSPHLYTVLSGWAFRYKTLEDGRRQILNVVLPGDFLGLQSSMMNEMQHSVESLTPMVLCVFPRAKLWELYASHPSLAYDLTWLAARSERLLDENLLSVGRRSASERIAYMLLDIFLRARHIGLTKGASLALPLSQQHVADALGLSLVHTNRTLKSLLQRRLFRWKAGILEILDEPGLAIVANYPGSLPVLRPLI
ncbi:MAG: Crp/Fnr family transcriptional regulator [Hyphomicrobiaceae bacterium]|nr:Crp/Fnr family transcriptional regulator [Hyphomicrobiaceae bacterium]